eukprot:2491329-Ditylum_brightwellii.AAC.1
MTGFNFVTALTSAVVMWVASAMAAVSSFSCATRSSDIGATAYTDHLVAAVAAVGVGKPPDNFLVRIIFSNDAVMGVSISS